MWYTSSELNAQRASTHSGSSRRRLPFVFAIVLLLAVLLSACGGSNAVGQSNITLKLITWNNPATVKALTQLDTAFHQKYPNITVQPTIVSSDTYDSQLAPTRLQANDVDILSTEGGFTTTPQPWTPGAAKPTWQQWIDAGLIKDLSGQPFLNNFYPSAIQNASTYNGKVYSIPGGLVAYTGIMYNKDIFAKYSLQVPTTYSEFVHVADTLKSHGVNVITTGAKEAWPTNLMAYNIMSGYQPEQMTTLKGLWTGSVKFTDPKMVSLLQHAQKVLSYMETNFTGEDTSAALGRFSSGQTAMLLTGSWDAPTVLATNPDIKLGYFPNPLSDNASDNAHLQGKYADEWYIAAHSKNQDAALKWFQFFSDHQNYTKFASVNGILPVQDASVNVPLSSDLKPYISDFQLAWDQISIQPSNVGQYAAGAYPNLSLLSPAGNVASAQDLAQKAESDWMAAVHKS